MIRLFTFTQTFKDGAIFEQILRLTRHDAVCTAESMRAWDTSLKSVTVRETSEK